MRTILFPSLSSRLVATTLVALAGLTAPVGGAPEIPWSSIDGGVERMSGAGYVLTGTVGQHDAAPPAAGAGSVLWGGFWQPTLTDGAPGCTAADLAPPFGVLDLADINTFVGAFLSQEVIADLDGNGVYDLSDITAFTSAFLAGCP